MVVINNAVSLPNYVNKKTNKVRTFLFLGALIQRKGVINLLAAVKKMKDQGISDFHLLIAGSGAEEQRLKEYVQINGIQEYVEFLGWMTKEQKTALMKKSDVLVLPSYNEGLPIAVLEAMSYGLPIISTNVGSIAEAVKEKENGFLIEPGDVDSLANAMIQLINDSYLWEKESKAARKICENKFSEDVFFEAVEKVYRGLYKK